MASDEKPGSAYYTMDTGKVVGPYAAILASDHLDVTKGGKNYPTKLDFGKLKKVTGITFQPHMGKKSSWSSWTYWNHGQWAVDRFTNLS